MHEASLIADLMHRIEEVAAAEGRGRVVRVDVWLGALSHISAEHFAEHFERAAASTPAEGADLRVSVSDDPGHPDAQHILLQSLELET